MSASALKENIFTLSSAVKPDALPWLEDAKALNTSVPAWVSALRSTAAESFSQSGLPQPTTEGWQFTNLRALKADDFAYPASAVSVDLPAPLLADSYRVVVLNGQFRSDLSRLPQKAQVISLMQAAEKGEYQELLADVGDLASAPFKALNSAYLQDGFVLNVPANHDLDLPVEVLFFNTGASASYPRMLYVIGENAGATVFERYEGEGAYFQSAAGMIEQKNASRLRFYRILKDDVTASHMNHMTVRTGKDAVFEGFAAAIGGALLRQDWRMQLINSRISASIAGVYLINGNQNHDITIVADHFEPDCQSVQHFKGVIDDKARSVFQGKIHVHRPAQKTDGYQSHHALLLSDRAEANTKPELEIYADDVKCSHGATAGFLNPDALFYMRSRGIPDAEAKALLIDSFLAETLERVSHDGIRDIFANEISGWLKARAV